VGGRDPPHQQVHGGGLLETRRFRQALRFQCAISLHELNVPAGAGVRFRALQSDVEMGGTDQKFNLLVGANCSAIWPAAADSWRWVPDSRRPGRRQQMSKSLGNYIGITEPPEVMFPQSDAGLRRPDVRYYELLTDRSLAEIAKCGLDAPDGRQGGARKIVVTDFTRPSTPMPPPRCSMPWCAARRFLPMCHHAMPDGVRVEGAFAWNNCWRASGWPESVSDAVRKIKAGAVQINGEKVKELLLANPPRVCLFQVGKNWKRVAG